MTKDNAVSSKSVNALLENLDGELSAMRRFLETSDPNEAPKDWKNKKSEEDSEEESKRKRKQGMDVGMDEKSRKEEEEETKAKRKKARKEQADADKEEAKRKRKQAEEDEEEAKRKMKKSEEAEDEEEKSKLKACAAELANDAKRKEKAADELEESAKRKEDEIKKDEIDDAAGKMRKEAEADKDEAKRKRKQAEDDEEEAEAKEKMAGDEEDEEKKRKLKDVAESLRRDAARKNMVAQSLEEDAQSKLDRAQDLEALLIPETVNVVGDSESKDSALEFLATEASKLQESFQNISAAANNHYDSYYTISEGIEKGKELREFADSLKKWNDFVSEDDNDFEVCIIETKKFMKNLDEDLLGETYSQLVDLLKKYISEAEASIRLYDTHQAVVEAKKKDGETEVEIEVEPADDDDEEESKKKLKKAVDAIEKLKEHNKTLQRRLDNITSKMQETMSASRNKYEKIIESLAEEVKTSKEEAEKKITLFMDRALPRLTQVIREEEALSPSFIDSTKKLDEIRKLLGVTEAVNIITQGVDESRVHDLTAKITLLEKRQEEMQERLAKKTSLIEMHRAQSELAKRIHGDVDFDNIMEALKDKVHSVSQIDEALAAYKNKSLVDEAVGSGSSFTEPTFEKEPIKEEAKNGNFQWTNRLQELAGITKKN